MAAVATTARFIGFAVALAGLCALVGFLVTRLADLGPSGQGAGWGMTIGGALVTLIAGQSGSTGRMAAKGRWGPFGHYWGESRALPRSSFSVVAVGLLVAAGGIALVVLTFRSDA